MATFTAGFISDLSAIKDNITLRVRIVRAWMQPLYNKPNVENMELVIMDEQNTKMQATVRMALVKAYKHQLEEGSAVTIQRYSLGEIQPKYRIVKNRMRLSFLSNTVVANCPDFTESVHGFDFRPFKTITELQVEEDGRFVVACGELDNFDKNGKSGKKKPLTLIDVEGNEINCTLWGTFADQFCEFLNSCTDHGKIIVVLQFAIMKKWDGKMCIQNAFWGSKLFIHNGKESVLNNDLKDIEDFTKRLFANEGNENSQNTVSRISTASKYSTKDDFVNKFPHRNIVELLDVTRGMASIIVGTIIAIKEEEGWWYIGCRTCRKKVIKASEYVDLEEETKKKISTGPNEWFCTKCNVVVSSIKTQFRLQIRVQDETGTISLSLFNDEVQAMVDRSAYQLCDKYGKTGENERFPSEITGLIGRRFAFKVAIDEFNAKKLLPVFNVLRLSVDPEIIQSLIGHATPTKTESEATSMQLPPITPLDLESQTDENTTPTNALKSTTTSPHEKVNNNKRASDEEPSSECSNTKRKLVEVKIEKDP